MPFVPLLKGSICLSGDAATREGLVPATSPFASAPFPVPFAGGQGLVPVLPHGPCQGRGSMLVSLTSEASSLHQISKMACVTGARQ